MKKKLWYWVEARGEDGNLLMYNSSTPLSMNGEWCDYRSRNKSHKYCSSCLRIRTLKQLLKYVNKHPEIEFLVDRVQHTKSKRTFLRKMIFRIV